MRKVYSQCLLLLLVLVCNGVHAELIIEDGYVRGLPPGQATTAAFMTLINDSDVAITINTATTDSAERAEIHAHKHQNGMMSMQRVDGITIPANGEFALVPGDHHLMLIDLVKPLREGDVVNITLDVVDGKSVSIQLPVRSVLNEHLHH